MKHCHACDVFDTCRIPVELNRLKRVHKAIGERGGRPWLAARIEQYMAIEVCLSFLFGLDELHAKAADIEAALSADSSPQPPHRHVRHQSIALEITLQRHRAEAGI